jgi:hypothetical protein
MPVNVLFLTDCFFGGYFSTQEPVDSKMEKGTCRRGVTGAAASRRRWSLQRTRRVEGVTKSMWPAGRCRAAAGGLSCAQIPKSGSH